MIDMMDIEVESDKNSRLVKLSNISERMKSLDLKTIEEIINVGEIVYFSGLKWGKQYLHKDEIQKVIDQMNAKQSEFETEKLIINEKWENVVSLKQSESKIKETYYEETIRENRERIKDLEQQVVNAISVAGRLESLIGKGSSIDNSAKGDFGENVVEQHIINWFPKSELQDMSSFTARGDRRWKLDYVDCLVEVKNVQTIKSIDVQKFERDFMLGIKNGHCNCALFISLKAESVPTKGQFCIEFVENRPIVYIAGVYKDQLLLKFALETVISLQGHLKHYQEIDEDDESVSRLKEDIGNYVRTITAKVNDIMKNVSSMKTMITNQEKTAADILKSSEIFCGLYKFAQSDETNDIFEETMNMFVEFYKKNNRYPIASEIPNYKPHIFRDTLSLKKIKAAAISYLENLNI